MASHLSGIFWFCSPFWEFRGINSRYLLDYKGEAYFTHYSVIVRSPAKQVSSFPSHFSAQTWLLKQGQGLNYSRQQVPWPESLIYLFHFFFLHEFATLATLRKLLVAKVEVLPALATVLVAISSPTMCTFPFSHFCKTNKYTSLRSERPFLFFAATEGVRNLTISSRKYDL